MMIAERVQLREVGPRDGLQSWPSPGVPIDVRVELVSRLARTGLSRIEVGSFVSERAVPQMAGSAAVVESARHLPVSAEVLVVNTTGAERASATDCDALVAVVAATDSFSARNVRSTVREAVAEAAAIAAVARRDQRVGVANIAVAFGCPDEGEVPIGRVADLAAALAGVGFEEVYLSDTIGVAGPREIAAVIRAVTERLPVEMVGLHLHDTRGMALVNAATALEEGVRRFDASVGGIGGCPFAPGASGNVATEDLVHLVHRLGLQTSVNLGELVGVARWLGETLGVHLPSHMVRARPWGCAP